MNTEIGTELLIKVFGEKLSNVRMNNFPDLPKFTRQDLVTIVVLLLESIDEMENDELPSKREGVIISNPPGEENPPTYDD